MMRWTSLLISLLFIGCTHSPLTLGREKRLPDGFFSGFSSRVVSYSHLSSDGEHLYLGTSKGRVYSILPSKGKKRWRVRLQGSVDTKIGFSKDHLYVGTSEGKFYALQKSDGKEVWQYQVSGEIIGQPVVVENAVLFGANDGAVYAVSKQKGELLWRYRRDIPDRMTIHGFAGVVGKGEIVYTAFSDGGVVALRMSNGEPLWVKLIPTRDRFTDVTALLLLQDKWILAGQFDGSLYALNLDGQIEWTFLRGGSAAVPIVYSDRLVIPMPGNRVALMDPARGAKEWEFDAGETARWSGLASFGPHLLAANYEGKVMVLEPGSGKRLWTYDFTAAIQGAPIVIGKEAWLLSRKGRLFSLRLR